MAEHSLTQNGCFVLGRPLHNRHSRTSPTVIPAKAGIQGGEAERRIPLTPHKAVAPTTRHGDSPTLPCVAVAPATRYRLRSPARRFLWWLASPR